MEISRNKMLNKPQHPKVLSVLMRYRPLSPVNLARDSHQPATGYLNDLPKVLFNTFDRVSPAKEPKQDVQLNIGLNKIRSRRNTLVANT